MGLSLKGVIQRQIRKGWVAVDARNPPRLVGMAHFAVVMHDDERCPLHDDHIFVWGLLYDVWGDEDMIDAETIAVHVGATGMVLQAL